jgi:hypothetical protein
MNNDIMNYLGKNMSQHWCVGHVERQSRSMSQVQVNQSRKMGYRLKNFEPSAGGELSVRTSRKRDKRPSKGPKDMQTPSGSTLRSVIGTDERHHIAKRCGNTDISWTMSNDDAQPRPCNTSKRRCPMGVILECPPNLVGPP